MCQITIKEVKIMKRKPPRNMPTITTAQALAEGTRLDRSRMNKLHASLNTAKRYANRFRMKASNYYEAHQFAPAKTFLTMAKRLDQLQADAQVLMTVPKIREILTGLTNTLSPMIPTEEFDINEIRDKVEEIFSDEMISFDSTMGGTVSEADMRELERNFAMSMNQSEADAFRRMEEVVSD